MSSLFSNKAGLENGNGEVGGITIVVLPGLKAFGNLTDVWMVSNAKALSLFPNDDGTNSSTPQ